MPSLSMTRGDRFPVEVKFISSGKFVEWPAMASGKLMLKQPGAYTALPVASALGWVKSGSAANAVYKFDLNLNTVELNALLTGASVNLVLEIEWVYENVTQSSVPVPVVISKDYIQGNEAAPVNAVSFREVQLQKGTTHIQWRYVGDLVWTNLIALDDLKGAAGVDGGDVEFQKGTTHLQWRYVGGTTWTDLVALDDLKGADGADGSDGAAGDDGKEIELQKGTTHIQWRYVGGTTWTSLVLLDDLKGSDGVDGSDGAAGADGSEIELQKGTTHIQWRYVGGTTWTDLVLLDDLKGSDGADGSDGAAGVDGNDGAAGADALWNFTGAYNLGLPYAVGDVATYNGETWYRVNSNGGNVGDTPSEGAFWTRIAQKGLDGSDGGDGADGADGSEVELQKSATHIQWRYVGEATWTNLVALDDLKGSDGADGSDGAAGDDGSEVELQKGTTHLQWRYVGGATWNNLVALDDLKGAAGSDRTIISPTAPANPVPGLRWIHEDQACAYEYLDDTWVELGVAGASDAYSANAKTVYIAPRTDGIAGNGTISNPYDASTEAKFDALIPTLPESSTIVLLPGTYYTKYTNWPNFCSVIGSGINNTKIVNSTLPSEAVAGSGYSVIYIVGDNVTVSNLTIDCNWQNIKALRRKNGAVSLLGRNCMIDKIRAINFGGDYTNGYEAFPVWISSGENHPNPIPGLIGDRGSIIQNCIVSDLQPGADSATGYATYITIGGDGYGSPGTPVKDSSGIIRNNICIGPAVEGSAFTNVGGFGICLGAIYDHLEVSGNTLLNLAQGIYGDTWINKNLYIKNNFFRNCGRSIGLTFSNPDNKTSNIIISENTIQVPLLGYGGGGAARIDGVENLLIEKNTIFCFNGDTNTINNGSMIFVGNCNIAQIKDNIFYNNMNFNGCLGGNVGSWLDENNRDENGVRNYWYSFYQNDLYVNADFSDPVKNGLQLARAVQLAMVSQPFYNNKSATNKFTVFIGPGIYNLPAGSGAGAGISVNSGFLSFIGTGNAEDTIIRCTTGPTVDLVYGERGYYTFKNMTIVGSGGYAIAMSGNGSTNLFENVIFSKEASGTTVPQGGYTLRGTWINCRSDVPMYDLVLGQGLFKGTMINCTWNAGIAQQGISGQITGCYIKSNTDGNGINFKGFESILPIVSSCILEGSSGISNAQVNLFGGVTMSSCIINNAKTFVQGSNKMYNTTISAPSSQTYSLNYGGVAGATIELFSVGANKPIDPALTKTNLTSL